MLKLKLQYFSHLVQRTDSLEKNPRLGKIEGRRRRGRQRMRRLDGITGSMDTNPWASSRRYWKTGKAAVLQSVGSESDMTEKLTSHTGPSHRPDTLARKMLFQCFRNEMQARRGEALTWGHSAQDRIRNGCLTPMPVTLGPAAPAACGPAGTSQAPPQASRFQWALWLETDIKEKS